MYGYLDGKTKKDLDRQNLRRRAIWWPCWVSAPAVTFLIPLHLDPVGLEEALVGQSGGGTRQDWVLIQSHKGWSSFTAWHVDGHLERGKEGQGSRVTMSRLEREVEWYRSHLTGLNTRRQDKVRHLLHV